MARVTVIVAMAAASWFVLVYLMVSGVAETVDLDG